MPVKRWTFTDVFQKSAPPYTWTFPVNPKEGGSLNMTRPVETVPTVGNRRAAAIEGARGDSTLTFSGSVLTQDHLEMLELWHMKRVLIELRDDLGRIYRGVFSGFTPQRIRKASNFWYHSYEAQFTVLAYRNASGTMVFGDTFTPVSPPGIDDEDITPMDWDGGFPGSIPTDDIDGGNP